MLIVLSICYIIFTIGCFIVSKKYSLKKYLWGYIVAAILWLPISLYISNFWNHKLSRDPEMWGVFGDYIGGVYNVLISMLVVYISYRLSQMKSQAEKSVYIASKFLKQIHKIKKSNYNYKYIEKLYFIIDEEKYNIDGLLCKNLSALADNYSRVGVENVDLNTGLEDAVMRSLNQMSHGG